MRDLLVVVPTRGRPQNAIRLLNAVRATATEKTDVIFGIDDDDDTRGYFIRHLGRVEQQRESHVMWEEGPRMGMAEWTNYLVDLQLANYNAFASLGDDHLPRTPGWDKILLDAISPNGGISYGDDKIMGERLCTAPVVSQNIVAALGWMCEPGLKHMCIDNCLKDIGEGAGCLFYCPEVVVEHLHWCNGKAAMDSTYKEAEIFSINHVDWLAYSKWRATRMTQDIELVKELLCG